MHEITEIRSLAKWFRISGMQPTGAQVLLTVGVSRRQVSQGGKEDAPGLLRGLPAFPSRPGEAREDGGRKTPGAHRARELLICRQVSPEGGCREEREVQRLKQGVCEDLQGAPLVGRCAVPRPVGTAIKDL